MPYRVSASDVLEARLFRNKDALQAMLDGWDFNLNEGVHSLGAKLSDYDRVTTEEW
jgi:hypothetical protein